MSDARGLGPFTAEDAANANRFSHVTTTAEKLNQDYTDALNVYYADAQAQLQRWGITSVPDNVAVALTHLGNAYVAAIREQHRATGITPGTPIVGASHYRGDPQRADSLRSKALEPFESAKKSLEQAVREHDPHRPIGTGEADAAERLQTKIAQLEQRRDLYKAINQVMRKKVSDTQKRTLLHGLGLDETKIPSLFQPDYMGRVGIPAYELTNMGAEIRRLKERLAHTVKMAQVTSSSHPFDGGVVEDNAEDNRVRIIFDSKPDGETITKLKEHGFKWAPSVGAWQRQRSGTHVLRIALDLVGLRPV